jgi:hypothetical protein
MARQIERHRGGHTGWLRAAVLGANDGILSTSSLVFESQRRTSPARCRWLQASIFPCIRKPIRNEPMFASFNFRQGSFEAIS